MTALLLAVLVGGATFLALYRMDTGTPAALAAALVAAVLFEAIRDTWQGKRDQLVAHERWEALRRNDLVRTELRTELRNESALRRILRGRRA